MGVVEQVGFVDDHDRGATAFGVFGGQGVGGLGGQGGGVETGHPPECADDVMQHAADPDRGVGQVDDDVAGGVQGGGGGPDGDGFAGADFSGDDADGVLVDTPGDAGDGFAVAGVAMQHGWCRATPEGHPGESAILLQPFDTHAGTPSWSSRSSVRSWPGIWSSVLSAVGVNSALYPMRRSARICS